MERIRIIYSKSKKAIFLDDKDLICVFENSLKRAKINFLYKDGKPDFILAYPLPVGIESVNELIDIAIEERVQVSYFIKELNSTLPSGITCLGAYYIDEKTKSIDMSVVASVYVINFVYDNDDNIKLMNKKEVENYKRKNINSLNEFLNQENIIISRNVDNVVECYDVKNNIKDVNLLLDNSLELTVDAGIRGNVNLIEIMDEFIKNIEKNIQYNIKRVKILYI